MRQSSNELSLVMNLKNNIDLATANSFGEEWEKFSQEDLNLIEAERRFDEYFHIFPWDDLPEKAEGIDIGCGSGRWDKFVAPRVEKLHCVEPAEKAINIAKKQLARFNNIEFHNSSLNDLTIPLGSQDFCFSLGVLHHVPNTFDALLSCVQLLKPKAPILIYLYYKFDNRSKWFKLLWKISDKIRKFIIRLPSKYKNLICEIIALVVYLPCAKISLILNKFNIDVSSLPLSYYKDCSFYSMRTDARDRFGTPIEQRFTRSEIIKMCDKAGLENIVFSSIAPYWCFVARKK